MESDETSHMTPPAGTGFAPSRTRGSSCYSPCRHGLRPASFPLVGDEGKQTSLSQCERDLRRAAGAREEGE